MFKKGQYIIATTEFNPTEILEVMEDQTIKGSVKGKIVWINRDGGKVWPEGMVRDWNAECFELCDYEVFDEDKIHRSLDSLEAKLIKVET